MPRQKKILVADTPEELEQQLRAIAVAPREPRDPEEGDPDPPIPPDPDEDEPEPDEKYPDKDPDDDDDDDDEDDETVIVPPPPVPANLAAAHSQQVSHYEARIHIVDAWKYQGSLTNHPDFVDPGWVSWADYDETTKRPAGPALRVPTDGAFAEKLARKGDYIVRQAVTIAQSLPADLQLDVWTEAEFERIFIPTSPNPNPI